MRFKKIYIELSDICGLSCDFCPSKKALRGVLSPKHFEKIAAQIYGKSELFTLHLLGDPLILKNLEDYLNIAKKYQMKLEITTSGFYLTPKNQTLLLKFDNIHQINLSLIAFLAQKKQSLELYFEPILELCRKHLEKKLSSFINLRLWNLNANRLPPAENEVIYKFLSQNFNQKLDKTKTKNRLARHIILHQVPFFEWPNLSNPIASTQGSCYALNKQLGILSDGTLVPCCFDTRGDIDLGNILEKPLEFILNSHRFLRLKEGFAKNQRLESLCQRCKIYKVKNAF